MSKAELADSWTDGEESPITPTSYDLISADSHVNEPPDLWTSRVSKRYVERAPRIEYFAQGDAYVMEGVPGPIPFGRNMSAGLSTWAPDPWARWSDVRRGGYIPGERLKEQDLDSVDAEVIYPTPRIQSGLVNTADPGLQRELVRAYNDWLSEYCAYAPARLIGVALLPATGIDDAVAEIERTAQLPGIRSFLLGRYPSGSTEISSEDDKAWAAIQATGLPVAIHVRLTNEARAGHSGKVNAVVCRFADALIRLEEFLYSGVFQRFPGVNLVMAEVDAGWVPSWREQAWNRWRRNSPKVRAEGGLELSPLYYMKNISFTYITDRFAVHNRQHIGVEQLMWSSDYPHSASDYPFSWRTIESDFFNVPPDEKFQIIAGNAMRLYNLKESG
jgi:uncharacterized protein